MARKLKLTNAPATMTTHGQIWRLPRSDGDSPAEAHVSVAPQAPHTLNLPGGTYAYTFSYSSHDASPSFTLVVEVNGADTQPKTFTVNSVPQRVYRFNL